MTIETKHRFAGAMRLISMLAFLGSLVFFYAYASDTTGRIIAGDFYVLNLPKSTIFYAALAVFAIINILINAGIGIYKGVKGTDRKSILFRSEKRKTDILFWLHASLAGLNIFIASVLVYTAFTRFEDMTDSSRLWVILVIGAVALLFSLGGMTYSIAFGRD